MVPKCLFCKKDMIAGIHLYNYYKCRTCDFNTFDTISTFKIKYNNLDYEVWIYQNYKSVDFINLQDDSGNNDIVNLPISFFDFSSKENVINKFATIINFS